MLWKGWRAMRESGACKASQEGCARKLRRKASQDRNRAPRPLTCWAGCPNAASARMRRSGRASRDLSPRRGEERARQVPVRPEPVEGLLLLKMLRRAQHERSYPINLLFRQGESQGGSPARVSTRRCTRAPARPFLRAFSRRDKAHLAVNWQRFVGSVVSGGVSL